MVEVAVVGSINQDLTVTTPRHPIPGETVLGTGHFTGPGGKGANQAVAVARLGGKAAMVGRVGSDTSGHALVESMLQTGVDTSHVSVDPDHPTGLALITVDDSGENSIVVSPGANAHLLRSSVESAAGVLSSAGAVLVQLEVPLEAVTTAAQLSEGRLCLNPAPATTLPRNLLDQVDVLIPNRSELAVLAGEGVPRTSDEVVDLARLVEGPRTIVVTLGPDGALLIEGAEVSVIPSPSVETVDTVGAGDAFCGALALGLARGETIRDAANRAVVAGALATTRAGAQTAMPTALEVEKLLGH